jgi:anti-anti-sigma factor
LSATVADGMTGYSHKSGQELVAQGFANIGSAIFGGMPATGAIARTATNSRAGARTPLAGIFHAGFLLIFLMVAGKLIAHVPLPKGVEVFRFAGPMFFGVARDMLDALDHSGRQAKVIILRMEQVPYIDSSGARALEAFVRQAGREGTHLILCNLREQPSAFLAKLQPAFLGAERAMTFQSALDQASRLNTT